MTPPATLDIPRRREPVTLDLATPARPARLDNIDLLRGIVMVVMVLDHVRDFLSNAHFNPADLSRTTSALFLTRWVTHFCAPVFMFLAGVGASLYAARGRSAAQVAWFLLTRGIWLIVLEFTVIRFGWQFGFSNNLMLLVFWALGLSMIALAGLVFLPRPVIAAIGVAMIAGHNLLDGIHAERFGAWAPLWRMIHEPGGFQLAGLGVFVMYCAVPWIGVMAAGYALGPWLARNSVSRPGLVLSVGIGLTAAFVILRALNGYGDPNPWSKQPQAAFTWWSFLNTTKYPPSLCFLLMTLGPAIAALPLLARAKGPLADFFVTFGRVPLFFYIPHIYAVHFAAIALALIQGISVSQVLQPFVQFPTGFGVELPWVYAVWGLIVLSLYPPCRWFADYKRTHRAAWLSYI